MPMQKAIKLYFSPIIFTILVVFWSLWNTFKRSIKVIAPLPPGPAGLPIVGYLPFLGTELHKKFAELAVDYGPIYKIRLGTKLCVVISSPTLVKEVVRDHDSIFANRDAPIAALVVSYGGNDIVFSPSGPDWRKMRKIFVREMLSNTNISESYGTRREEVNKSIKYVYDKRGIPINVGELTSAIAMNTMMSMVWGETFKGDEKLTNSGEKFRKLIAEQMVFLAKPNISDFFPLLAIFDLQRIKKKTKENFLWLERIVDSVIEKRMSMGLINREGVGKIEQKKDLLQILLEIREHESSSASITMTQLKAILLDIVVAGTDTTATMSDWVMASLMKHPEAMRRVHEELTEIVGLDNSVEESHLPKLHYLDAVIKETFRLHPALPHLIPRCPKQSSIIGGYTIPKGTQIFLNMWSIHRDPMIWENPLEFQPERFLKDPGTFDYSGNNYQYLPFGSGRRICAGLPLAEKMLTYVLASLLHSFDWNLPPGTELELSDRFGIVLKKNKSLVAIPTPRLSDLELYS
ncbi:putative Cytochrome P450 [Quillaja saponaria]|uniref:Cytochrome P450 n=1 Tax=Quillaja saponaria TaxID=32244 RepID=A0AAD7KS63_QUISA|nr:putative Cytochrome P450 [Quillaja saponaria]